MNQWFEFRHFTVRQERCAMKVGTDGVLLGAWADGADRILDIGAGTGLIALMMAQRFPGSEVDAVEIERDAATQAMENAEASPFSSRITVIESSIQDYAEKYTGLPYGAVVSNPPFFNSSLKNPDKQRSLARHTDSLSYRDLFFSVSRLLADDGVFSVVIPDSCRDSFMSEAAVFGFFLVRETFVRTTPRKQPKRILLAFMKRRTGTVRREEVAMMSPDGSKSQWYARLTEDFYLSKD